ncbi:MAG: hypothetical protein J7J19_03605 [Thaumarchaeota archaeon]|nr:hypothetical protein [Nitrososphaerota archaeon]
MISITLTLDDNEYKALTYDIVDVQEWVENALHNKARQVIDRLVAEHTSYNPAKIKYEDKLKLVATLKLKTAKKRQEELEQMG